MNEISTTLRFSLTIKRQSISNATDAAEDSILLEASIANEDSARIMLMILGLSVHMTQVHKESLGAIENALPNRAGLEVEIFGMEGIPDEVVASHRQRVITQYAQAEAERRASTGNPAPGSQTTNGVKKPKIEDVSDIKKRLAEHKAKKAAEEATAVVNNDMNQMEPIAGPGQGYSQPAGFVSFVLHTKYHSDLTCQWIGSPSYGQPFAASGPPVPPGSGPPGYNGFPQPYGQPAAPFQAPPTFGTSPAPQFGQQPFVPPQPQFQSPNNSAYAPPSQYLTGPSAPMQNGPPRAFGANSPPIAYQVSPPPPSMSQNQRPTSLPSAPGLPQRPAFGAPPVNAFQMQQIHQGQIPGPSGMPFNEGLHRPEHSNGVHIPPQAPPTQPPSHVPAAAPATAIVQTKEEIKSTDAPSDKKSKKEKEKDNKLIYSDNEVSPEEKMAKLPRYAFDPKEREETVLGPPDAAVTGVVSGPDDPPREGNRGPGKDN